MALASSNKPIWFLALATLVVGCGGGQSEANDPNSIETLLATPTSTATPEAPPVGEDGSGAGPSKEIDSASQLNEGQKAQMETALRRGVTKVSHCAEVVDNCPLGTSDVEIVFDGKQGKITDVHVNGPPFAGTPAEACIKRAFIKEFILPFDGDPLIVPFKITIGKPKGGAVDKGAKPK
jgi:hypothetical protein